MTLEFGLTFAGVPFLEDRSVPMKKIQREHDHIHKQNTRQMPDILDEVDRIIPFHYLTDYVPSSDYPGRNITALARKNVSVQQKVRVNEWWYPNTASRWSVFRGLASSSMVKAMTTAAANGPATFSMLANPTLPSTTPGSYLLTTQMRMLPPRPLGEQGDGSDGLYLVTLVDERYWWQYYQSSFTIVPGQTTWDELINVIAVTLGITITYNPISSVYPKPEADSQFWSNQESITSLLDAIAYNIGCVVVRNMDGTYKLMDSSTSQAIIQANRGDSSQLVRTAGGDFFNSGNNLAIGDATGNRNLIAPSSINVVYPIYIFGNDPIPHFLNNRRGNPSFTSWYEESYGDVWTVVVPIASGGSATSGLVGQNGSYTVHSTAKALFSGELNVGPGFSLSGANADPVNLSGLRALSMQIAQNYYTQQVGMGLDEVYPGTLNWTPEGVNDVLWTYSPRKGIASTRVMRSPWNTYINDMQHSTPIGLSGGADGVFYMTGGKTIPQTWRDSNNETFRLVPSANITAAQDSSGLLFAVDRVDYFPTQNRWFGQVNQETILFEGTSGGMYDYGLSPTNSVLIGSGALSGALCLQVVYRGCWGTAQVAHSTLESVQQVIPNFTEYANLIRFEKTQYAYPGAWTSGGVREVHIVPQLQEVFLYENTGTKVSGTTYYSGSVCTYMPIGLHSGGPQFNQIGGAQFTSGTPFISQEPVWVIDSKAITPKSGGIYHGINVGSSPTIGAFPLSGQVRPIYLINCPNTGLIGQEVLSGGVSGNTVQTLNQARFAVDVETGIAISEFGFPGDVVPMITALPASISQQGVVTPSPQTWAGPKTIVCSAGNTGDSVGTMFQTFIPIQLMNNLIEDRTQRFPISFNGFVTGCNDTFGFGLGSFASYMGVANSGQIGIFGWGHGINQILPFPNPFLTYNLALNWEDIGSGFPYRVGASQPFIGGAAVLRTNTDGPPVYMPFLAGSYSVDTGDVLSGIMNGTSMTDGFGNTFVYGVLVAAGSGNTIDGGS